MQSIRRKRGQAIVINGVTVEVKCIYPGHVILHVTGGGAVRAENSSAENSSAESVAQ